MAESATDAREGFDPHSVDCQLAGLLAERKMTLSRLSDLVGVSIVNLSILKTNKAKAIRFSTLQAICQALDCEIGELLTIRK